MLLLLLQNKGVKPSGGKPYTGYETRQRTDRDIRRMREELGLVERAAEIIEEVAQRQAASLVTDEQKRFEELARKLELERIGWEARYLELLNQRREYLIEREIAMHMQRKFLEEQNAILLLLAGGGLLIIAAASFISRRCVEAD